MVHQKVLVPVAALVLVLAGCGGEKAVKNAASPSPPPRPDAAQIMTMYAQRYQSCREENSNWSATMQGVFCKSSLKPKCDADLLWNGYTELAVEQCAQIEDW